ncbi:hypothetical protein CDO87_03530 [Sagittula sp. P11]|uniref:hypothetical protein n=1 Tax=Sagittula sp. P11 TaxID=2009329 RepID=UPI000C2D11B9|nr:hypothetical protein [Sagittula sp. P11]AUC52315.1 hypothetical protein CDO87_03530 [Sagittula sp. P11]
MDRVLTSLKFQALTVALNLKADTLQARDLDRLLDLAVLVVPPGHPVVRAIVGFHGKVLDAAGDPAALTALADDLLTYIDAANMPETPDQDRRDIYG